MSRMLPLALAALAAAVAALAAAPVSPGAAPEGVRAAGCTATLNDGSGPFNRGLPPRRAKIGTGHVLTGVVLSEGDCGPLAGATVELWQSNRKGVYVRAGSATVVTDRAGRFRFEGPRPAGYEGRPGHIHLRVTAKGHEQLFTRYAPATASARRGTLRLVLVEENV
jgi:protocatechuate 3,4-dioxygenase beta subunit